MCVSVVVWLRFVSLVVSFFHLPFLFVLVFLSVLLDKSSLGTLLFLRVVFCFSEFCLGRIRVKVPAWASSSTEAHRGGIIPSGQYLALCSICPCTGDIFC